MNEAEQVAAEIEREVAGRTLLDALADTAGRHPDVPALAWRSAAGCAPLDCAPLDCAPLDWESVSWGELPGRVAPATAGLQAFGVGPGDRVGILMSNRPELAIADLALLHARAVPVCLFDSFTDDQLATVLRTLAIDVVLVDGAAGLARLTAAAGAPIRSIAVEPTGGATTSWPQLLAAGAARPGDGLAGCRRAARPDDVVSVNYTSGTTGSLKGVQHTHHNVLWHAESFARRVCPPPGTRFLSYLPRAHATERFVTTWFPLVRAGTVHLCPDPAQLPAYLADVRPEFFGGVLRVWEKLYAAAAGAPPGDVLTRLGLDACWFAFSGGGALAPHVQEFFHGLGLPLAEGWGQSELVSAATLSAPDRIVAGTVGPALPGVEVRRAGDGELLVRSGSRMLGYAADPGLADPVDADGFTHTGDLGEIDGDGVVRILGRREDVITRADGYRVGATRVESQLRANLLVDQACLLGECPAGLAALLVVAAPAAETAGDPTGDPTGDLAGLVAAANRHLPERERVARFGVLAGPWLPGRAEELTHTGKLRRPLIAAKHAELIEAVLAGRAGVAVPAG
jgi:long-subunit acyl-CoA synthetase (AMP-forming)